MLYYTILYYTISYYAILYWAPSGRHGAHPRPDVELYILQRGVQWKQGVVIRMLLYTILLYNTTPIHYTPLPLHPPQGYYVIITITITITRRYYRGIM